MNNCAKCQRSSSGSCYDISYEIRNVHHMVVLREKSQDHKSPKIHPLGTMNRTMMNLSMNCWDIQLCLTSRQTWKLSVELHSRWEVSNRTGTSTQEVIRTSPTSKAKVIVNFSPLNEVNTLKYLGSQLRNLPSRKEPFSALHHALQFWKATRAAILFEEPPLLLPNDQVWFSLVIKPGDAHLN